MMYSNIPSVLPKSEIVGSVCSNICEPLAVLSTLD